MKHIKTFESFSINEEEGVWGDFAKSAKSWAGIEADTEVSKRKDEFLAELKKLDDKTHPLMIEWQEKAAKEPKFYSFDEKKNLNFLFKIPKLKEDAEENKYRGALEARRTQDGKIQFLYKPEHTGLQKLAKDATPTGKQALAAG